MMLPRRSLWNRRQFLTQSSQGLLWALAARVGGAAQAPTASDARSLVLIELTGGNDGLATVIPFEDDRYHRARPNLRALPREVLRLDDQRAFPPGLAGLQRLFLDGKLAIVEGVGYPNPARSHFRSLEIWHAGDLSGRTAGCGWAGRLCAAAFAQAAPSELMVHFGPRLPFSLYSTQYPPIALESPTAYQWFGHEEELLPFCASDVPTEEEDSSGSHLPGRDAMLNRLRGVLSSANESSERIRAAVRAHEPSVEYPRNRFAASLRDIAALVHAGLGSRVLSTNLASFDTHANQKDLHANLLRKLDPALCAFMEDLATSAAGQQTLVVVYSEFGRRLAENASAGTDHGKAGPVFVLGAGVRGGFYGRPANLATLSDGDPVFTTDFRRVYATLIERWFRADVSRVLGQGFDSLDFI